MSDDSVTDATASGGGGAPRADPVKTLSPRRLQAYSDGVFAIAATLLVLDLSVDTLDVGDDPSSAQLWHALGTDWPSFVSFGLSFVLLGLLWAIHARQFEVVERVDSVVLTLNTLRLLGVVLVPFTTSLTDRFSEAIPGRFLLPLNFFYILAVGYVQWWYLSSAKRGLTPHMSASYRRSSRRNALIAMVISAGVAVLSIWIGSFAFFLFLVSTVIDQFDRQSASKEKGRRTRRQRRASDP
ncbi:TMEM175 family protein [Rathayibacter sp. CAU 1779]